MTPFFTSDYSLGRSILKLKPSHEGGPKDILTLAKGANLKEVFLVEDTMIGFLEAQNAFFKEGISLRFGVRFDVCNSLGEKKEESSFKIILFARNDDGCRELYNIFSAAKTNPDNGGFLDPSLIKECPRDNLLLVHPFYDSFLFHNTFYFKNCLWEKMFGYESFAIENNNLPQDLVMSKILVDRKEPLQEVKTILYECREDVEAYQTYRMACNRSFGRARGLSNPNLKHFASREFCFQSYSEKINGKPYKI